MRARFGLGIAAGLVLLLSSVAHAFGGWPPMRSALIAAKVDSGIVGALAVGWYFGSVAMLVFGTQMILAALQARRRADFPAGGAKAVAVAYLAFGLTAFVARDFNPHFLFFAATGVLVGAFAFWPANRRRDDG